MSIFENKKSILSKHFSELGKKGGSVKSDKKKESGKANLAKARQSRWEKKNSQSPSPKGKGLDREV